MAIAEPKIAILTINCLVITGASEQQKRCECERNPEVHQLVDKIVGITIFANI
jgi:hypothetical protein